MNKLISDKKTLLAIVFGVAMIATLETLAAASAQSENGTQGTPMNVPTIQGSIDISKLLESSVKTSFVDAAKTAAFSFNGGQIVGGGLGPYQGYYVYTFMVSGGDNKMHMVIVDAGNGKVLSNTEVPVMPGNPLSLGVQPPINGFMSENMIMSSAQAVTVHALPSQNK